MRLWLAKGMDRVKLRKHDNAFLLVRIGAGDNGDGRLRGAPVVRQVGNVCGDIDEVPGAGDDVMLKPLAVPGAGFALQNIDCGLMPLVFVRFRPRAGRHGENLHMNGARADRFR